MSLIFEAVVGFGYQPFRALFVALADLTDTPDDSAGVRVQQHKAAEVVDCARPPAALWVLRAPQRLRESAVGSGRVSGSVTRPGGFQSPSRRPRCGIFLGSTSRPRASSLLTACEVGIAAGMTVRWTTPSKSVTLCFCHESPIPWAFGGGVAQRPNFGFWNRATSLATKPARNGRFVGSGPPDPSGPPQKGLLEMTWGKCAWGTQPSPYI